MARVHDSISVTTSCEVVFDQLTRFESYPRFMAGVKEVRRRDDGRLEWHIEANGREEEWVSEIVDLVPPHRLAWRAPGREGAITCRPTAWGTARIYFDLDQEPLQPASDGRHYLEATRRRTHADLENFREWLEQRERLPDREHEETGRTGPILPA